MDCLCCVASAAVALLLPMITFVWKAVTDRSFLKNLVFRLFLRLSKGESHFIKKDGEDGELHYVTMTGNLSKGPRVLVIHGLSSSCADFVFMCKGIRSISSSAVFVDLPGHGKTTIPLPESESWDDMITKFAEIVHSVLAHDDDHKYVVIGHSMGGYTAMRFASLYPHKVSSLILISPAGAPKRSQDIDHIKKQFNPKNYKESCWSVDNLFSRTGRLPSLIRPVLAVGLKSWTKNPAAQEIIRRIKPTDCIGKEDVAKMKGIRRLLFWGNHEGLLCRFHFEYLRDLLAGQELKVVELENTGHMAPSECPDVLEKEIKAFLAN